MKKNLFDYIDYKKYLGAWISSQQRRGHGFRKAMAEHIGCQTAFVSQVMNGNQNFSLEQAHELNSFLGHSAEEGQYFLLIVMYARAGSKRLQETFLSEIRNIQESRLKIRNRLKMEKELSAEVLSTYFGNWYYSAIHVLLTIPKFRTKVEIANALRLPMELVANVLEFFVQNSLATQQGDQYVMSFVHFHLSDDSPMISKHHSNWRIEAMKSLDRKRENDAHYSSVVSLSRNDVIEVKKILLDALEEAMKKVKNSKEEELYSVCFDFFKVDQ